MVRRQGDILGFVGIGSKRGDVVGRKGRRITLGIDKTGVPEMPSLTKSIRML